MSLQSWEKNSWLVKHSPTADEVAGTISEGEAKEMIRLAKELKKAIAGWLKKAHPELVK